MLREWCTVICLCLSVSNEAASVHHKKQTNSTVTTTPGNGGNLSSGVEAWLVSYWYVIVVILLVLVVSSIFACACVVKKVRGSYSLYRTETTRSVQPSRPFPRHPPLSSMVDGSLSPGMVSVDQSPVPSPQPSYSSQQSHRSSGRSSTHKKKRTLSPGQNSSDSEETIRSDKGMLRGPWQQKASSNSMVKLSISGMALEQQQGTNSSLPEATSMLSVRSNHSGRSTHSVRSGHSHSDASSQKTVVEVDVKLHLSPDQEQDARIMTAAALAESARQLARSAARLGEEEEHYQIFSHSPPRTYYQPRITSSQIMREFQPSQGSLPPQRDTTAGHLTTPLTCTTISLDRAANAVSLDHPVYSPTAPQGKYGYLPPQSPLTAHRSMGPDLKRSMYQISLAHSPTKLSNSGIGSLDRTHTYSPTKALSSGMGNSDRAHTHSPTKVLGPGIGSLDRAHTRSPTKAIGSLDRAHTHSPTKPLGPGIGSLDRAHTQSPTKTLKPTIGSLDRTQRSSGSRTRIPSVNSDRLPWRYGDVRLQDPLRQFYEQDISLGQTNHGSQDMPPGYRYVSHTGTGYHGYGTLDVDSIDVDTIDMDNAATNHFQDCSSGPLCSEDESEVRQFRSLPRHYITNTTEEGRVPLSFGQLPGGVIRSNPHQLKLKGHENGTVQTRVPKHPSGSCADDSGIQTTPFSEEQYQMPVSPCCSSSAPSVEEDPQVVRTESLNQDPPSSTPQNTSPALATSSLKMVSLPRSNSGLSVEERLSTASGYAATGSASSIDIGSNGPPSQPNQYELEPRIFRRASHSGVGQCNFGSLTEPSHLDPSSPDLTPQEQCYDHNIGSQSKGHNSISKNWIQPTIKYSNHGDQESISVEI